MARGCRVTRAGPEHRRRDRVRSYLGAGCVLAVVAVVPACSASTTPAAAPTSSTTSTTTSVTLPDQNPAELAACVADARSLQTALTAYMAEKGAYPAPPAPWSAAAYAANFQPLTATGGGGPFLAAAPGTKFYVIEYDSAGQVWIAPPGSYGPYDKGQDIALSPNACDAAVE
jgi:hypothetical protein